MEDALTLSWPAPVTLFADPYKKCVTCGLWADGVFDVPGPIVVAPCGCRSNYLDVCPSWGPVDGCRCAEYNAEHPDDPIVHDMRPPTEGDGKVY